MIYYYFLIKLFNTIWYIILRGVWVERAEAFHVLMLNNSEGLLRS